MDNFYLFLIDYARTILFHPILKGVELSIIILLWQLIGGIILSGLTYLLKPMDRMFSFNIRYLVLSFGLLLGFFLPIFIATTDWDNDKSITTVFQSVFRTVAKLEVVFVALTLIILILGVGILVPVYSIVVGILNFAINVIPVISGIILVLFCVIFFVILGFLGSILVRF